ncbi:MAG: copper-binding protein [Verrucomicrobia bacterium]|nr:copper-binding protein [Verrucomicrobiota bacterium]
MQRLVALLLFCLVLAPLRAASPLLTLENELLPSPAPLGASKPLSVGIFNGSLSLAWTTTEHDSSQTIWSSTYNAHKKSWRAAIKGQAYVDEHRPSSADSATVITQNAGRMAKAWFETDEKDPRILVSISPNAGEQFLMPVRVEDTRPTGTPDLVLLADGTVFVSWPEHYNQNETALWLRRISPGGSLSVPVLLAVLPAGQPAQLLAIVKDYDSTPAQLLIAYTLGAGESAQIVTRLLTIAPPVATANPCQICPDPDEAARGHALRGRVVTFSAARGTLTVNHGAIPDVLASGTTEFKVDPAILKQAAIGNEVFARIEKRDTEWWLFAARLILRRETPTTHQP